MFYFQGRGSCWKRVLPRISVTSLLGVSACGVTAPPPFPPPGTIRIVRACTTELSLPSQYEGGEVSTTDVNAHVLIAVVMVSNCCGLLPLLY